MAERRPGTRMSNWWWYQEGMDLVGMQMAAQEEEREEGDGEVDGAEMETDYYVGRCCRKKIP